MYRYTWESENGEEGRQGGRDEGKERERQRDRDSERGWFGKLNVLDYIFLKPLWMHHILGRK